MNTEYDFSAATETARDKVQQALDTARQRTGEVVARSGQCVRERPASTLLAAFVVGVAVGAAVALSVRPAPPKSALADRLGESRDRLADLFATVASNLRGPVDRTRASVGDGASALTESVARALKRFGR